MKLARITTLVLAGMMLAVISLTAQAQLTAGRGFQCDIDVVNSTEQNTTSESGQYPKGTKYKDLNTMMNYFHNRLKRLYPPGYDDSDDNKVKCSYRDPNGKGNYTVYYYVDSSGRAYGAYDPDV